MARVDFSLRVNDFDQALGRTASLTSEFSALPPPGRAQGAKCFWASLSIVGI